MCAVKKPVGVICYCWWKGHFINLTILTNPDTKELKASNLLHDLIASIVFRDVFKARKFTIPGYVIDGKSRSSLIIVILL